MQDAFSPKDYRGRIAPSPTGYLHLGHARTFWIAQERATRHGGALILRNEDLDRARCSDEFVKAMFEDLQWFGFRWSEGPDIGGLFASYSQSERSSHYRAAFDQLRARGSIYPCTCSRQDVQRALSAPHQGDDEPIYPGTCRSLANQRPAMPRGGVNWRFRVSSGEQLAFTDGAFGPQTAIAGRDFGDFLVWRKDDLPSYQLAVVVDDAAMRIAEVVRGADLIASTFRQLLLYRALDMAAPAFYHCALMTDAYGIRLAKRTDAASLSALRAQGRRPEDLRRNW
jgi:glutamyl/glutaminyl-tRNA synthetase